MFEGDAAVTKSRRERLCSAVHLVERGRKPQASRRVTGDIAASSNIGQGPIPAHTFSLENPPRDDVLLESQQAEQKEVVARDVTPQLLRCGNNGIEEVGGKLRDVPG